MKKRTLSILLSVILTLNIVALPVLATDENSKTYKPYPEATYELKYKELLDGTLSITGYTGEAKGELILPEKINGKAVTNIDCYSFNDCNGFRGNLTIPDTVTEIGFSAFEGCNGFRGKLTLGKNLVTIGQRAFKNCINFTGSLEIPDSVKMIGPNTSGNRYDGAFSNCYGFNGTLTIGKNVEIFGSGAFAGCSGFTGDLVIPDNVTEICHEAFLDCSGFDGSLVLPDNLKTIESYAFMGCSGLTGSLILPAELTKLEEAVFYDCKGFTGNLMIPNKVEHIYRCSIENCSGIGSVIIPDSVQQIDELAFCSCKGLKEIKFQNVSAPAIDKKAFYGVNATAWYAPGWDKSALQNYAGKITWKTCCLGEHVLVHHEGKPATCTDSGWEPYDTCENCDYTTYKVIPALGHDWGEIIYDWNEGHTACTAKRACRRDPSHIETSKAYVTSEISLLPTCTEPGQTTYTAVFNNDDWPETQTVTVTDIDAYGHLWEISYKWNENYTVCTATRTCQRDPSHRETINGTVTSEITIFPTCTKPGERKYTAIFPGDWVQEQNATVEISALGHDWGEVTYIWDREYTTCIAKRTCKRDKSHVNFAEAKVTSEQTKTPGIGIPGEMTYTAEFTADWAETQVKVTEIPALSSDWSAPDYEWNEAHTACLARRVSQSNPDQTETAKAVVTTQITTPATCTEKGKTTYTAVFTEKWAETQTLILENIDALGHDWREPVYEWNEDYTYCIATRVCKRDKNHTVTATANRITAEVIVPTCEENGKIIYHAIFIEDWAETQTKTAEEIEALGHDWGEATYEWGKDGKTCTVTRGCKRDKSHVETAEATVTGEQSKAPTCTEKGDTTYTATFDVDWAKAQTKTVTDIDALGHDWGEATYEWSEDGKACTATRACKRDENHVETAEAEVTSEQTKAPAVGVPGEMTWTAKFHVDWAETQMKGIEIPALKPEYPEIDASEKFNDVPKDQWYCGAVSFAVSRGLFGGTGDYTFEPDASMTRAMLVTVLWRYEGQPAEGENIFTDVPEDQWFTEPVAWAAENGIVGGVGDNKFDPDGNVTREQMAAILYRYAGKKGFDASKRGDVSGFPDEGEISRNWALEPLRWAVGEGLIGGSDGKLLPQGNATRAQVSAILMRFIQNIAEKTPA